MKTKIKIAGLLLLAIMVALPLFSACAKEATPAPTAKPAAPTATPAPIAKPVTLRWSVTFPTGQQSTVVDEWAMDEIEKRTGGRIKFERFFAGTITKAGDEIDAVKTRLVDCATTNATAYYSGRFFLWGGYANVPFTVTDNVMMTKIEMKMLDLMPELRNEIEQLNQKVLWAHPVSNYHLYAKTPIKTLEDLKGKKMGAVGLLGKWISVLGCAAVASPIGERYSNLKTGLEEGGLLPLGSIIPYKLDEVAPYYTLVGLGTTMACPFIINNDAWKELSKSDQDLFLQMATEIPAMCGKLNDGLDQQAIEAAKAKGGAVFTLSDEDRAKWAKMLPNIPKEYAAELEKKGIPGNKFYDLYFKTAKEFGWKFYRDWWAE